MDTLPEELVCHIISYLDLRCQLRLSTVSVWWRAAVSDSLRRQRSLELDYPTDAELRTLLPRLPGLRALHVSDVLDELDVDIVSENCPRLEKLDLTSFRLDTDSLERLCQRCPRLWDVRLPRSCKSVLLELLLRQLPGIRALRLFHTYVSAVAVALMPAGLERLELFYCEVELCERHPADRWQQLTEPASRSPANGLDFLVARCPALTALLGGNRVDVDILSKNCPNLEKLDLRSFRLDKDSLERLCRCCPRLWDVTLPQGCSSELLELLLRWLPGVRALSLRDTDVSAAAVTLLPAGLERLELDSCRLQSIERQPADRWPRLKKLGLYNLRGPTDELAALVAGCPHLADFSCGDDVDHLLDLLPALHMRHLDLSCGYLTEERLVSCFGRLRQLRTLDLDNALVTDRVLDTLAGVGSLTELSLGADTGPMPFTMEALERLVVSCRSLRSLRLNLDEEKEDLEWLIAGLDDHLDRARDVTLAAPDWMLQELAEWAMPLEPSPLRLVRL